MRYDRGMIRHKTMNNAWQMFMMAIIVMIMKMTMVTMAQTCDTATGWMIRNHIQTIKLLNQPTDQWKDTSAYRDARTHLTRPSA